MASAPSASSASASAPVSFIAFLVKDGTPVLAGPTFAGPDPAAALEWCIASTHASAAWKAFTLTPLAAAATPAASAPVEPKSMPVIRTFLLPMNGEPREFFLPPGEDGGHREALTRVVGGPPVAYFHTRRCHETFMMFVGEGGDTLALNPNLAGHRIRGPAVVVRGTGPHDLSSIPVCVKPADWMALFDR